MILDLDKAKEKIENLASIWTRVPNPHPRFRHASVFEPVSQRLWIIGGSDGNQITSDILEIPIKMSLRDLAIDCAANSILPNDPRLGPGKYPKRLREEIEAYRPRVKKRLSSNN